MTDLWMMSRLCEVPQIESCYIDAFCFVISAVPEYSSS